MEKEIQQWLEERLSIYSLLAALYRGEIDSAVKALQEALLLPYLATNFDNSLLKASANELVQELNEYEYSSDYRQKTMLDYHELFLGPDHLKAPPWQSVYLSKDKLLFSEQTSKIEAIYRSFGLAAINSAKEPADHIALELGFMARLCSLALQNTDRLKDVLAGQQLLLGDHLVKWVPSWAADVKSNAQTNFWSGCALLTQGWLENDLAEVKELVAATAS